MIKLVDRADMFAEAKNLLEEAAKIPFANLTGNKDHRFVRVVYGPEANPISVEFPVRSDAHAGRIIDAINNRDPQ